MAKTVLDASALLAFINHEPGAERVMAVLGEAAISTVNLSEVVTKLALRNRSPRRILEELTEFELEVVDFNRVLAEDAGLLATATRGRACPLVIGLLSRWRGVRMQWRSPRIRLGAKFR